MCKKPAAILTILILFNCAASPKYRSTPHIRVTPAGTAVPGAVPVPNELENAPSLHTVVGIASWYGSEFHGRKTSNGETYDMYKISAAHRYFPFGTWIRVTNLKNNYSIITRINDRGPFIEGRILDLSYGAAQELGMVVDGIARVRVDVLRWGPGEDT